MSDAALRACERELSLDPASLDRRRRHARLLLRAGREEEALSALDLAWRLGAEELEEELRARLEARALHVRGLELRYVPAGPFVMGSEDFDEDAAPAHLVQLSAFYISRRTLRYSALHAWEGLSEWLRSEDLREEYWSRRVVTLHRSSALGAPRRLSETHAPPRLAGSYSLPSEAQWERAFRALLLDSEATSIYGVEPCEHPEWTGDVYEPAYYERSPRFDPPGPPQQAKSEFVVRGAPPLPPREFVLYREAASATGGYRFKRFLGHREVRDQEGIALRVVFGGSA